MAEKDAIPDPESTDHTQILKSVFKQPYKNFFHEPKHKAYLNFFENYNSMDVQEIIDNNSVES